MVDNFRSSPDEDKYVPFTQYVAHDEESKWSVSRTEEILRARPLSSTKPVWFLAFLPLWGSVAALGLTLLGASIPVWSLAIAAPVVAFVCFALAKEDARILVSRGFDASDIPSPRIAALAPWFYLLRRASQLFLTDHRSFRPFWHHIGQTVLVLLMAFVFPFVAGVGRYLLEQQ